MGLFSVYRYLVFWKLPHYIPVVVIVRFLSHHTGQLKPCNVACVYHHEHVSSIWSVLDPGFYKYQPHSRDVGGYVTVANAVRVEFLPWVNTSSQSAKTFLKDLAGGLTQSWNTLNSSEVDMMQDACSSPEMHHKIALAHMQKYAALIYVFLGIELVLNLFHDVVLLHADPKHWVCTLGSLGIAISNMKIILAVYATRFCAKLAATFVAVDEESEQACFYRLPCEQILAILGSVIVIWKWTLPLLPHTLRVLTYGQYYYFREDQIPSYIIKTSVKTGLMKDEADYFVAPRPDMIGSDYQRPHVFLYFIPEWSFKGLRQVCKYPLQNTIAWNLVPFATILILYGCIFPLYNLSKTYSFKDLFWVINVLVVSASMLFVLSVAFLVFAMCSKRLTFESRIHCYLILWESWLTSQVAWFSRDLIVESLHAVKREYFIGPEEFTARERARATTIVVVLIVTGCFVTKSRQYRSFLGHLTHLIGSHCCRDCLVENKDEDLDSPATSRDLDHSGQSQSDEDL